MSINREKLSLAFTKEYEKLNPQQRKAVDQIEGPVMVIAGPGTGKTQILASRIGKILLDTDALPNNILCLTYTDAGVVAMRKRLLQFIGPDAYKVNIYTFHAFCNDVIQDNLSLFEKSALDPISELEKIELLKSLIDQFPKNHPLKRYRGDVYYEVNNLANLFSTMKKEGWSVDFLREHINNYLASLPTRDEFIYKKKTKEFNAGDLKQNRIAEETERMEKLQAAIDEFDHFQQMMRQRNRYDFDDMINWVIKAFEENPQLLTYYQERFQYILVDEYQDTSGTQNRLVELLISYWDVPNVFVVGDDDQSIFRFQGANVENMLDFAGRYSKDLLTVVLTSNYRSTQPIIDTSKSLIDRNNDRLVNKLSNLSKQLQAANDKIKTINRQPVIRAYENMRQEMIGIMIELQSLIANGVLPGKIGVIYKENKYGEELARYCKQCNIPTYSKRDINILETPLARKIILLMNYLASEHFIAYSGDEMLFEILHFDWFDIPSIEIAKASMDVYDQKLKGKPASLRQWLNDNANAPQKDLFSTGIHTGLKNANRVLEMLIQDVPNITLQQLTEKLIREAGVLTRIMQADDKFFQLSLLNKLFDFIKEETRRNPMLQLQELVDLIALMQKEGIALRLAETSGSDKGVNLMTAHGSKGLEFEYVFFAGCNAGFWEKKRKPGGGYKFPDTLFTFQSDDAGEEELRRLFYVALTRAEQHLYISYSRYNTEGKELEPSMFIAEIQDAQALEVEMVSIGENEMATYSSLLFENIVAPKIESMDKDYIVRALEKFSMNVTALNNFLKCPLEFYYRNLIRIPSPKNEATEFGSAVHHALEKLFRKMQDDAKHKFPSKKEFTKDFEWYMNRHRESFTKEQFKRRMEYGDIVLSAYYDTHIHSFNTIVAIELNIRNVTVKDVPLKGKLDKLEFDGKSVNVVDYKTGDPERGIEKMKGPSEKLPLGGDYWRQAVFYKILVDNNPSRDWKVISSTFDFIEPDKKGKYHQEKMLITEADITTVSQQIIEVWERIQAHDFYTGCGKEDCHWCEFVRTNKLSVAVEEEEL